MRGREPESVFPLVRPPRAAIARVGLAAAGLLAVAVVRLGVPRLASYVSQSPLAFYAVSSLASLGVAAALYLALRGRVTLWPDGWPVAASLLGGLGAWLAAVGVAGFLDLLGRGPGGGLGILAVAAYSFSYALALVLALAAVGMASDDMGVSAALAAFAYAGVTLYSHLSGGTSLPAALAVAASTTALAGAVYVVSARAGAAGGAAFLGLLQTLTLAGPVSIGGSYIVGAVVVSLAALAGWLVVEASLGSLQGEGWEAGGRISWRKLAVAAVIVAVLAAGGYTLAGRGVVFWRPYVIVTGSMEPTLMRGDMVILQRVDPGEVNEGDIITFLHNGVPVTHRVVEARPDGTLQTKGDANAAPDPYTVSPDQVLGRVYAKIPKVGWLVIALNWNPTVRLASIIGITVLLAAILVPWRSGDGKSARDPGGDGGMSGRRSTDEE